MRWLAYLIASAIIGLGFLFIVASAQALTFPRLLIGGLLVATGALVIYLSRVRPVQHTQHLELRLTGDVSLENMTCKQCGGQLSRKSVRMAAGAVFIACEYCGAEYQLEEAPKW